jgi:hypothetical protein
MFLCSVSASVLRTNGTFHQRVFYFYLQVATDAGEEKLKMEVALPLKEALTIHPSSMAVWFSG